MSGSGEEDREWKVVPSRSNRPLQDNGDSATEPTATNRYHNRPPPPLNDHSSGLKQRVAPQGRGEGSQTIRTPPQLDGPLNVPGGVRLLRRQVVKESGASHDTAYITTATRSAAMEVSMETVANKVGHDNREDMSQKIGAPIIRPSAKTGLGTHVRQREPGDETGLTSRSRKIKLETGLSGNEPTRSVPKRDGRANDAESGPARVSSGPPGFKTGRSGQGRSEESAGLIVLPHQKVVDTKESIQAASVNFDLSSDNQWPSIAGVATGSGRGLGVWPSGGGSGSGKGWSAIVKTTPAVKPVRVKREVVSPGSSEGEGGDAAMGGATKKKKSKKKKKSGDREHPPPPQEKKLDTPILLDFSQYMTQVPTRPVLHRKEDNTSSKQASVVSGNVLDSTAPVMRRGKERETPKHKKPTPLRKIIDKEKEAKRQLREKGQSIPHDLDVTRADQSDRSQHSGDEELDPVPLTTPTDQQTTPPDKQTTPTVQQTTPPVPRIHNRKFREYCSHVVTEEINAVAELLLQDLVRFQDRQHARDPIRAKSKRRYVCGLREVHKHLGLGKLKCIVIPPNLDRIQSTGGIDQRVSAILALCQERGVRVVHALSRRRLALILRKKYKMGCVGIFSYDGAEAHYRKLMRLIEEATEQYLRVSHLQAAGGPQGAEISTLQDPQTESSSSDIGDSFEEDEHSVPVPENGNGTSLPAAAQVMDSPWKIFFQQTNEIATADHPTNQKAENSGDITVGNQTNQKTENRDDTACHQTNQKAENSSDITVSQLTNETPKPDSDSSDVTNRVFQWNVDAAEFKPSFVS